MNISDEYFDWLYSIACRSEGGVTWRGLMRLLYDTPYRWDIPHDENRAADGKALRTRFGHSNGYSPKYMEYALHNKPASVFEVLLALSIRCEEHIMADEDFGDRSVQWFWEMLSSIGFNGQYDGIFNKELCEEKLKNFLDHNFSRNGKGGLFTLKLHPDVDVRKLELWYALMYHIDEVTGFY